MRNRIGSIVLGGLSVFMALAGWWSLYDYLENDSNRWVYFLLFFAGWLVFILILTLISIRYATGTFLISVLPPCLFLFNWHLGLVVLGATAVFYTGMLRIKSYKRNAIQMRAGQIIPVGYSFVTTGLCLVMGATYFFWTQKKHDLNKEPIELDPAVSEQTTETIFKIGDKVLGGRWIARDWNMTADEKASESLKNELKEAGEYNDGAEIPKNLIDSQRVALSEQWGVAVSGDEKMSIVYNKLLNKWLEQRFKVNKNINQGHVSSFWVAAGMFITLKAAGWIIRLPLIIVVAIIFNLLTKTGMLDVRRKQVIAERV
ncbi:MAG: hypothetical protein ABIC19_02535 [Patescibacteria group bacterium]|nr:hypothetical protein [Patescibacteria group bacterium]